VDVVCEKGAAKLRPGTTARCRIRTEVRKQVLAVPVEFVMYREGMKFCKVKQGADVVDTPVRTGASDDAWVEILEGLREGQEVVRYRSVKTVVNSR
jgi:hypothetical protein